MTIDKELTKAEALNRVPKDINEMASGAFFAIGGKFAGRGFQALTQVILARYLGPTLFGIYALGWTIFRILGALSTLGLEKGVLRFGTAYLFEDKSKFRGLFTQSIILTILFSSLLGALLWILSPTIALLMERPELSWVLRFFAVALPLQSLVRVIAATMQTTRKMLYSALIGDVTQPLIFVLSITILTFFDAGVQDALIAVLISFAVSNLLGVFLIPKLFPNFYQWQATYEISNLDLVKYAAPTAFAGIFTLLTIWTDRLFVGYFLSSGEVGVYQALSQFSILFAVILQGLSAIFAPLISKHYAQKEMHDLNQLYKISTKWGVYLILPMVLTILFHPKAAMLVVFGENYIAGAEPLRILTIGQFVNVATGSVGFLLIMTGFQTIWFRLSLFSFLLNIILNLILVPRFGVIGASVATAVSISTLYLSGLYYVRAQLKLWPYDTRYLKGGGAAIITFIFLLILTPIPFPSEWLLVTAFAIVSLSGFFGTLYFLGFEEEDKIILRLLRKRVGQASK